MYCSVLQCVTKTRTPTHIHTRTRTCSHARTHTHGECDERRGVGSFLYIGVQNGGATLCVVVFGVFGSVSHTHKPTHTHTHTLIHTHAHTHTQDEEPATPQTPAAAQGRKERHKAVAVTSAPFKNGAKLLSTPADPAKVIYDDCALVF